MNDQELETLEQQSDRNMVWFYQTELKNSRFNELPRSLMRKLRKTGKGQFNNPQLTENTLQILREIEAE
jgi:hypothetical protein